MKAAFSFLKSGFHLLKRNTTFHRVYSLQNHSKIVSNLFPLQTIFLKQPLILSCLYYEYTFASNLYIADAYLCPSSNLLNQVTNLFQSSHRLV